MITAWLTAFWPARVRSSLQELRELATLKAGKSFDFASNFDDFGNFGNCALQAPVRHA